MDNQQRFSKLAHTLTQQFSDAILGALIAGSVAHSRPEFVRNDSDVDLVVIAESEHFLKNLPDFYNLLPQPVAFNHIDGFTIHNFIDDIEVSIVMYTPETFLNRLCALATTPMRIWRNNIGPGQYSNKTSAAGYKLRDFNGLEYEWQQGIFEYGDGYIVQYYPGQYIENHFILGSYPQNILNKPIVTKHHSIIDAGVEKLWTQLGVVYQADCQKGLVNHSNPEEFLRVIYDNHKMSAHTIDHLLKHYKQYIVQI